MNGLNWRGSVKLVNIKGGLKLRCPFRRGHSIFIRVIYKLIETWNYNTTLTRQL